MSHHEESDVNILRAFAAEEAVRNPGFDLAVKYGIAGDIESLIRQKKSMADILVTVREAIKAKGKKGQEKITPDLVRAVARQYQLSIVDEPARVQKAEAPPIDLICTNITEIYQAVDAATEAQMGIYTPREKTQKISKETVSVERREATGEYRNFLLAGMSDDSKARMEQVKNTISTSLRVPVAAEFPITREMIGRVDDVAWLAFADLVDTGKLSGTLGESDRLDDGEVSIIKTKVENLLKEVTSTADVLSSILLVKHLRQLGCVYRFPQPSREIEKQLTSSLESKTLQQWNSLFGEEMIDTQSLGLEAENDMVWKSIFQNLRLRSDPEDALAPKIARIKQRAVATLEAYLQKTIDSGFYEEVDTVIRRYKRLGLYQEISPDIGPPEPETMKENRVKSYTNTIVRRIDELYNNTSVARPQYNVMDYTALAREDRYLEQYQAFSDVCGALEEVIKDALAEESVQIATEKLRILHTMIRFSDTECKRLHAYLYQRNRGGWTAVGLDYIFSATALDTVIAPAHGVTAEVVPEDDEEGDLVDDENIEANEVSNADSDPEVETSETTETTETEVFVPAVSAAEDLKKIIDKKFALEAADLLDKLGNKSVNDMVDGFVNEYADTHLSTVKQDVAQVRQDKARNIALNTVLSYADRVRSGVNSRKNPSMFTHNPLPVRPVVLDINSIVSATRHPYKKDIALPGTLRRWFTSGARLTAKINAISNQDLDRISSAVYIPGIETESVGIQDPLLELLHLRLVKRLVEREWKAAGLITQKKLLRSE